MKLTGILVIDKPSNWTSHDVVAKLRGLLQERRIGHGGTLDPMATGVLPVFVGRATRAVSFLPGRKAYEAILQLGVTTDSQDSTGTVLTTSEKRPTAQQVADTAKTFLGDIRQVPPMVSAVKIGGQKLYDLARRGIEVERPSRPVTFYEIDVTPLSVDEYRLYVSCSAGTYIRTLCHDIGVILGCGGMLNALRRVQSGPYTLDEAVTLEQVAQTTQRETLLRPVDTLFQDRPALVATPAQVERILHGSGVRMPGVAPGEYRVYRPDGRFLMLGKQEAENMTALKSFFEVNE